MKPIPTLLPEITFSGELFCPHCGIRLFSWDDAVIAKCSHLVFAYAWSEVNLFLAVRADFAGAFMAELLDSPAYRERLQDGDEAISIQDQRTFCRAEFTPECRESSVIASYCEDMPEAMFPALLSASAALFKDDRDYSGVHIVVDWEHAP